MWGFLATAHNKNRLKDELQKMQYLYNDHISGVKIEVQKLYSIKVVCPFHIMTITISSISPSSAALSWPYILQKEELDRMMRSLSGDSKANIDKILEEFRNAKKVEYVTKKDILTSQRPSWCWSLMTMGLIFFSFAPFSPSTIYHPYHMYPYTRRSFALNKLIIRTLSEHFWLCW